MIGGKFGNENGAVVNRAVMYLVVMVVICVEQL